MRDSEKAVLELKERMNKRDDDIRALLSKNGIDIMDATTLLALLTIAHTALAQMTLVGQEIKKHIEAVTGEEEKKETVN